ncbi:MAG TPA: potassium channel family protein [Candidatus Acidoferrales bacterium]|nr:potassium channel family protein [Candidatus Acidoferrales bacterium]
MIARALMSTVGVLMIVSSLNDVFQSVIVPRAVARRLRPSYYQWRALWSIWPGLARLIHPENETAREDFLAVFAPLALVLNLMLWSFLVLCGFGLIFYALRDEVQPPLANIFDAFYFAGTSFFTIGFGDFVGRSGLTRLASLAAGAAGFGVISTTTAYLFALFGAFQAREHFVVTVGARAGSPPSGVGFLSIAARAKIIKDLPALMRSAETWCAALMETHLAYPVLAYFRSSHDYESWVGTLGTLLDTSVLLITTVECDAGEARVLYNIGRHAVHDLADYFGLDGGKREPGISREQYEKACRRLEASGLTIAERERAWQRFSALRSTYACKLNALAQFFDVPELHWIDVQPLFESEHVRAQLPPELLARVEPDQNP